MKLSIINTIAQSLLNLDHQIDFLVKKLNFETLEVFLIDINKSVFLIPTKNKLNILYGKRKNQKEIRNKISISISTLFEIKLKLVSVQKLFLDKKINYNGNVLVLQQYDNFFNSIHIDIFFYIHKLIGGNVSGILEKIFSSLVENTRQKSTQYMEFIYDYFTEELNFFPSNLQLEKHMEEIQMTMMLCEKLDKKVENYLINDNEVN